MNIFFAGGEDSSWYATQNAATTTASGFVSGFARSAMIVSGNSSGSYVETPSFNSSGGVVWVHFNLLLPTNSFNPGNVFVDFIDTAGQRVAINGGSSAGQLSVTRSSTGASYQTAYTSSPNAFTASPSTPVPIDVFLNYSASGQLSIYQNGTLVVDTGPNTNLVYSGATSICFVALQNVFSGNTSSYFVSEVLVASASTIGCRVVTLPPTGAGNTQSWTPSTLANINKTTINDSLYISATSSGVLSEWTTSTGVSGSYSVIALVSEARMEAGVSGPQHFSWLTRVGTVDYSQGSVVVSTAFVNYNGGAYGGVWYTNPLSGASWSLSDFNTAGFNIGVESQT